MSICLAIAAEVAEEKTFCLNRGSSTVAKAKNLLDSTSLQHVCNETSICRFIFVTPESVSDTSKDQRMVFTIGITIAAEA